MPNITSDALLPNIEAHIKVLAGPGAGKTRFLIGHIKNILQHSQRLGAARRIACITYTNVGVETIAERLGGHGGKVEISTIHAFLFKYIVKPYVGLIAAEFNLDAVVLETHDDVVLSGFTSIKDWKEQINQKWINDDDVRKAWESLKWNLAANGTMGLVPKTSLRVTYDKYMLYKRMLWGKGLMHHDDVLFFALTLINRFPFILTALRAQFPYFLIDEFQDTSPIQAEIISRWGQAETVIGVIGDEAQAIYSFTGARHDLLSTFNLPGMIEYTINGNWRSSIQIVDLLNLVRGPRLRQDPLRNENGAAVMMLVGDKINAYNWMSQQRNADGLVTLSRENITANAIQQGINGFVPSNIFEQYKAADGNYTRTKPLERAIKAVEYAGKGYYKDALRMMAKTFNYGKSLADKKKSLQALKSLLEVRSLYANGSLYNFYTAFVGLGLLPLPGFNAGRAKTFYENTPYQHMAAAVKNLKEYGNHITIHKSKGNEFSSVLLVLPPDEHGAFNEATELAFLLTPNLTGTGRGEENRVRYVAISRAQDHLAISVPALSAANRQLLTAMNVQIADI